MIGVDTVLLSVVVPVYRVEGYLYQCLESIRAGLSPQEAASVEVIAVDDASPDGCGGMLDAYAARHGDLRVVHLSQNVGLGLARNAGLAEARGTYVWFVDSDDRLPAGSVRAVLDRLRSERPDVLLIDHLRVHEDGRLEPDASSGALRDPRLISLIKLQHTAWNRIVRRGLLDEAGLRFLPGWYEDVSFSNAVLIAAERIAVLDRVCYHYRIGRLGAITATRSERHFEVFDQYDRMMSWVSARPCEPWLRHRLFTLMVDHLLVVAGNDGRLHPGQRRAFFRRLVAYYRRYLPEGYPGHPGLKHRLVRLGSYPLYAALRQAYRIGKREPEPSLVVSPAPAPAPAPVPQGAPC
ncbi:glycosyltransferase family 2 protein [Couchioplanes caeruleus]|uniref:CDP-glycerol--glycerophosphate glycerophosphotransferase n=2 Tax=Couchioplanes caeruleus TaxID=56438 RepID=A0A1K0G9X7_9ACTN|nr:glycosyltransferase [Couchioplanes caeruleus]OJF14042.1 CDP-glycerol--glycerophosphate glycerophosphotransferase [Couchioplanes caeruleus subsp. caeruleus]ROP30569.1 glycosyltransferase involved in cell wall biosynthesis [Couchioplanes caeruleus]